MPNYTNACSDCSFTFDSRQSIRDGQLIDCPACGLPSLARVLYPPIIFDSTPRTIGTLAERNNTNLGRYKLDSLRQAQLDRKEQGREQLRQSLPDGMGLLRDEVRPEKPWYRGDSINTDLAGLSPEKKANYIMTGDSNG